MKTLNKLKEIVLECIYNDVLYKDLYDVESITSEAEIILNNEILGYVKYRVSIDTTTPSLNSYYDTPDFAELSIIVEYAIVDTMYSNNNNKLVNVTNALNNILALREGKQLNY